MAAHWLVQWDLTPPLLPNIPAGAPSTLPVSVTEQGSSGSPLFNAQRRVVGVLSGGASVCGAPSSQMNDLYGKLSNAYTGTLISGSATFASLLDPANTGAITLDGIDADPNSAPSFTPAAALTRQRGSIVGPAVTVGTVADAQTAAGNLSVSQIAGGSATGITVGSLSNSGGTVSATVTASCTANPGTVRFQVSDSQLQSTGDLTVNLTANTAPTMSYPSSTVTVGGGLFINPSALGDNGTISSPTLQSTGTYTGGINVNGVGVIQLTNAAPVGTHTITIQTTDNCSLTTSAAFQLTVSATPNTAPTFIAGGGIIRQQGSAATTAAIGTVSDAQTAAGSLTVTQSGGSATDINTGAIVNSNGAISAPIGAGCAATGGTLGFQVSDGSLSSTANLQVNVTPNTAPFVSYANASINFGASGNIGATSGPSDNGSLLVLGVQSLGTYTGGINVTTATGIITLTNARPAGAHLITIRAADNCFLTFDTSFTLTVRDILFANGFQ